MRITAAFLLAYLFVAAAEVIPPLPPEARSELAAIALGSTVTAAGESVAASSFTAALFHVGGTLVVCSISHWQVTAANIGLASWAWANNSLVFSLPSLRLDSTASAILSQRGFWQTTAAGSAPQVIQWLMGASSLALGGDAWSIAVSTDAPAWAGWQAQLSTLIATGNSAQISATSSSMDTAQWASAAAAFALPPMSLVPQAAPIAADDATLLAAAQACGITQSGWQADASAFALPDLSLVSTADIVASLVLCAESGADAIAISASPFASLSTAATSGVFDWTVNAAAGEYTTGTVESLTLQLDGLVGWSAVGIAITQAKKVPDALPSAQSLVEKAAKRAAGWPKNKAHR
ncbi:MAG: hypothetical protein WCO94_06050 [Verrucomicrobiota bacterium]